MKRLNPFLVVFLTMLLSVLVLLLIIVLSTMSGGTLVAAPDAPACKPPPPPILVPRRKWRVDAPFAEWLSSRKTPIVLTGTVASTWQAHAVLGSTSSSSNNGGSAGGAMSARLRDGRLTGVYHHSDSNTVFGPFFDAARPMAALPSVRPRNIYHLNKTVPAADFESVFGVASGLGDQHKLQHQQKGAGTHLFVGTLDEALEGGAAEELFWPMDELFLLNPREASLNLWVGQPGAVTPCHYDGYHNMYFQLSGAKRFELLPPVTRGGQQPTFPFLHPSFGQCHARIRPSSTSSSSSSAAPLCAPSYSTASLEPVWQAELTAGDVLYIPPEWLHEATSLNQFGSAKKSTTTTTTTSEPSMSVNAWTSYPDAAIMERVFGLALPAPLDSTANYQSRPAPGQRAVTGSSTGGYNDRRMSRSQQQMEGRRRAVMGAMVVSRVLRRHFEGFCGGSGGGTGGNGGGHGAPSAEGGYSAVGGIGLHGDEESVLAAARRFFDGVLGARYTPLMRSGELPKGVGREDFFDDVDDDDDDDFGTAKIYNQQQQHQQQQPAWPWGAGGGVCEGRFPQRRFTVEVLPGGAALDGLEEYSDDVNALLCELSDDGQSVHSGWIANWVEYVAFAAVPLENIPLYIMQLGNCLGIDLLR